LCDESGIIVIAAVVYLCPLAAQVRAGTITITYIIRILVAIIAAGYKPVGVTILGSFLTGIIALYTTGAGIARMYRTAPAAALISTVTENPVTAGNSIVRMQAAAGSVTAVIGTHIPITGTGRTRWVETAVGRLLAGIAHRIRAGVAAVHTATDAAGIGAITINAIIAGRSIRSKPVSRAGSRTARAILRHVTHTGRCAALGSA
jgi:hypothetical protein